MDREDRRPDSYRPRLSDAEIAKLKAAIPYMPDMVEMVSSRRALFSTARAVRMFCIWFIGFSAVAIAFKQSVMDAVNFAREVMRGLFK